MVGLIVTTLFSRPNICPCSFMISSEFVEAQKLKWTLRNSNVAVVMWEKNVKYSQLAYVIKISLNKFCGAS